MISLIPLLSGKPECRHFGQIEVKILDINLNLYGVFASLQLYFSWGVRNLQHLTKWATRQC